MIENIDDLRAGDLIKFEYQHFANDGRIRSIYDITFLTKQVERPDHLHPTFLSSGHRMWEVYIYNSGYEKNRGIFFDSYVIARNAAPRITILNRE